MSRRLWHSTHLCPLAFSSFCPILHNVTVIPILGKLRQPNLLSDYEASISSEWQASKGLYFKTLFQESDKQGVDGLLILISICDCYRKSKAKENMIYLQVQTGKSPSTWQGCCARNWVAERKEDSPLGGFPEAFAFPDSCIYAPGSKWITNLKDFSESPSSCFFWFPRCPLLRYLWFVCLSLIPLDVSCPVVLNMWVVNPHRLLENTDIALQLGQNYAYEIAMEIILCWEGRHNPRNCIKG